MPINTTDKRTNQSVSNPAINSNQLNLKLALQNILYLKKQRKMKQQHKDMGSPHNIFDSLTYSTTKAESETPHITMSPTMRRAELAINPIIKRNFLVESYGTKSNGAKYGQ